MRHPDDPSETKKKASCHHCVQLLQELFSSPTNQASRLLYNMLQQASLPSSSAPSSFDAVVDPNIEPLPNGIRIRIPTTNDTQSETVPATESSNSNGNNSSSNNNNPLDSSTLIRRLSYNDVRSSSQSDDWIPVTCRRCSDFGPEANARAFVMGPAPLSIVVCHNRILPSHQKEKSVQEMDEIVTHELIHIYDVRSLKLNLLQCSDLAYSEIRAAREAECAALRHAVDEDASVRSTAHLRPRWSLLSTSAATHGYPTHERSMQQQQELEQCVRSRATTATQNLFAPASAQRCIQQVFAQAMADERPAARPGSSDPSLSPSP